METVKNGNHKIDEALHLLNQAAKEKREDLQKLVGEKYSHIRDVFADTAAQTTETVRQWSKTGEDLAREGKEKVVQAASKIDQRVHKDPWSYIAGVALGALVLGFVFGKSKK